jgi:hypothetical protein
MDLEMSAKVSEPDNNVIMVNVIEFTAPRIRGL